MSQNNLPQTGNSNFNNTNQNLLPRPPINNNMNIRSVYMNNNPQRPHTNMNNSRIISPPQTRGPDPSTIPGIQGQFLSSDYTTMQQVAPNQLRPTNISAESTNSQAQVPVNNISSQVQPAVNIQSINQLAGQSVNNFINISITQGFMPSVNNPTSQPAAALTNIENQNVVSGNMSNQPLMMNQIYPSGSMWAHRPMNPNQFTSDFPKFFKSPAEEARKKSSQDKEYEAKHLVPRGISSKPVDSPKRPTFRPPPKKPVRPHIEKRLVKEFIITGSMINTIKKVNLMRLHRGNNVLDKFQAPVKLHRRDPEATASSAGNTRQNEAVIASTSKTVQGPTTGADTSKIAPFAGARHNKKNLFKKRTTQIYLADDRQRQLKAEERLPWVLEDYDGTHTWVGQFEETDAKYGFLIKDKQDENKLRFLPSHRWYTFRPQIKYKTLTIEEAEEEMARAKKRDNDRWMMRRWGKQNENEKKIADEEGGIVDLKSTSTMKTVENEEDLFGSDDEGFRRPRRGIESDEEMEFEQIFEDDEEDLPDDANPIDEENAEVVKLKKRAIHKPTSLEGEDENEDSFKLTQEGMQLKKLVRKFDDNEAYDDSDQESNPYAGSEVEESEEELSSESPARTPIIGAAGTKPTPAKTDKGKAPVKPKASAKATVKSKAPAAPKPKAAAEKPKGKATATSKTKSTASKSSLSASEEIPLRQKLKSSDIPGAVKVPPKTQAKNMTATPISSSPEDSTKKPSSKPKNSKSVLPTSAKTTVSQTHITLKKQKAGAVRQPTSDMAAPFGKRLSTYDHVSDDDHKHTTTPKRVKQTEAATPSTVTAGINRSANANVARATTGVVKRVREAEDSMPVTGKKVRADKPVSGSISTAADSSNSRLISEREVRQIINQNNELTVTTIIKLFRKRIHEDSRNRERLLEITKNVAVLKNGYLVLK